MARRSERFLVWGAGGHGKVVADLIRALGHTVVGFVDSDESKRGRVVEPGGGRVLLTQEELLEGPTASMPGYDAIALAIGDNGARQEAFRRLEGRSVPPLVHPRAVVSPATEIGQGVVVFGGAVLNPDAVIGEAAIVNSAAVVEHDCVLGAAAHVSPNAALAGGVRVGERTWIGVGATVIQGLVVGSDVMVGAGAVVIRDVPDGCTVVGVPAAPLGRQGSREG